MHLAEEEAFMGYSHHRRDFTSLLYYVLSKGFSGCGQ